MIRVGNFVTAKVRGIDENIREGGSISTSKGLVTYLQTSGLKLS